MGSQQRQHKQQRSARNHHRSGGKTGMQRSTRLATKVPRETPGAPLPAGHDTAETPVDGLTALDFAAVARQLTLATQRRGLRCPLFRSPPDLPGMSRSLRHNRDGSVTVSVVVRGRYRLAVLADMIDGVVATNTLEFGDASRVRDELWSSISTERAAQAIETVEAKAADDHPEGALDAEPDRSEGSVSSLTVGPVAA